MNDRRIDQAIDRVAARLVETGPDEGRVLRQVMAQLPERTSSPWFMAMPVQLAAAAALVMIAFVFARPARQSDPVEAPSVATVRPEASAEVRSPISDPRSPIARRANPVREPVALDRPDHEFSLPPVAALPALELSSLTTVAVAPAALEPLAPLVLTDLPLASDSSSPHER